jgi:hypothetical protein
MFTAEFVSLEGFDIKIASNFSESSAIIVKDAKHAHIFFPQGVEDIC